MRHKTFFASIVRFPDRHGPIPPGSFRGRSTRFAAAMARVRRPVPFRTRKLRPCTAMVLHPRGCGRVARRRSTRYGSPRSSPSWAPGGFLVFPPATHARAGRPDDAARTPRTPGHPFLISLYLFIHSDIHPFLPLPPPFPPHVHSYPLSRVPIAGPGGSGFDDRGRGPLACGESGGDAMRTGPGARRRIPSGPGARPPDGPPRPGRPRETGLHGPGGGADGQGKRGRRRRESSLVYIGEDGGGSSVENMFHNGILSVG